MYSTPHKTLINRGHKQVNMGQAASLPTPWVREDDLWVKTQQSLADNFETGMYINMLRYRYCWHTIQHKIAEIQAQGSVYLHLFQICQGARRQQETFKGMLLPGCPSHYSCVACIRLFKNVNLLQVILLRGTKPCQSVNLVSLRDNFLFQ